MPLSREKAKLVARLQNPRFRTREGQFLVEGVRGAREFILGGLSLEIRFALISPHLMETPEGGELRSLLVASGIPWEDVSNQELEALSDTERPQGILMVVKEPGDPHTILASQADPRFLLLDGVQDPGNAGTLIRAAWAFGLSGVMALEGTVDPFNAKVVRASAGALAHIPVLRLPLAEAVAWLQDRKVPLLVADADGQDVRDVGVDPVWALVVGNEGAGVRPELMGRAAKVLAIRMNPAVESLNAGVAGAILLFALSPSFKKNREN